MSGELGELTDGEVQRLATYNAERSRGILHTDAWQEKMARLQEVWDARRRERLIACGFTEMPDGKGWLKIPAPIRWAIDTVTRAPSITKETSK